MRPLHRGHRWSGRGGKSTVSSCWPGRLGLSVRRHRRHLPPTVALAARGEGHRLRRRRSARWAAGDGFGIGFRVLGAENRVFLDEEDVSAGDPPPEVSLGASAVSARPVVRQGLLEPAAAPGAGRAAGSGAGGTGHRDGGVPRRGREVLPRGQPGGAGPAPLRGALPEGHRQLAGRGVRPTRPSGTATTPPAPSPPRSPPTTPSGWTAPSSPLSEVVRSTERTIRERMAARSGER